jgi:glycosyltransferase involved in cell wall biosynthesis
VTRVLMVGRSRYTLPLSESLAKKFDALSARFELRVLGTGTGSDPRFRLHRPLSSRALDGLLFYVLLPGRIARELRGFRPDAVLAQSPFEAAAALLARNLVFQKHKVPVVVELHGDPATFSRLYGSPLRRLLAPALDRLAAMAIRRADAVRALSPFTVGLAQQQGVEPAAVFTTFTDLTAFSEPPVQPLPERPAALFVGVLQRYKNVDGIAAAWRLAAPRVPEARLVLVGDGPLWEPFERLLADLPGQTEWIRRLPTPEIVRALDDTWALLLPSRSEGTPRVILEALCRGRAVIGGRVGGIPDAVHDGNGILVHPDDHQAIADALVRMLSDRGLAERLGAEARADSAQWTYTADEYAANVETLVKRVAG